MSNYYTNVGVNANIALSIKERYASAMFMTDYFVVFPDGDSQEIRGRLSLNQMVDVNGNPVYPPFPTNRMVVYRVMKVKTNDYKGGSETFHYLEQLSARELMEYVEE
ncbi:MAG: hypothetical protein FWB99_05025 [Treponema sp.]|nr:hypothetical protein [Treponema sp.]